MQNSNLSVIITGCGYKPLKHLYLHNGKPTHDPIMIDGVECKMNIGTAISFYFAKKGINVIMISRNEDSLEKIKQGLVLLGCNEDNISYIAADITINKDIDKLINNLPKNKKFYWVQSIGMGGGTYRVPNDNIYLPFEEIQPELIAAEMDIVTATHRFMLKLIPILRKQIKNKQDAKISIITSMSGERGYHFGATHVAAKHAIVGYIKGIEKELADEGIDIYDIRPGAIDTGMYDNQFVHKAIEKLSKLDNNYKNNNNIPVYGSPTKVARKVYLSLFSKNPKKVYKILAPYQS